MVAEFREKFLFAFSETPAHFNHNISNTVLWHESAKTHQQSRLLILLYLRKVTIRMCQSDVEGSSAHFTVA